MDAFLQKAKFFALETAKKSQELAKEAAKLSQELATETAKKSQELAKEAAKLSQELATETAKRSKEIAVEATKKADQLKAFAGDLSPTISTKTFGSQQITFDEELTEYGITPELREFVQGLTIKTFRDFPLEETALAKTYETENSSIRQDLSAWQERHAVLVLLAVPEMSDFRYVLCPRRMRETRFWKIYFILVKSYIAQYEAQYMEKSAVLAEEKNRVPNETTLADEKIQGELHETKETIDMEPKSLYQDLDAYLMSALDSSDEGPDVEDDDGFDADFDQLVNSTVDSEGEDVSPQAGPADESGKGTQTSGLQPIQPLAASEGSSDGELVEIPNENEAKA